MARKQDRPEDQESDDGDGSDAWLILPAMGISIPIIGILAGSESTILSVAFSIVAILAVLGFVARMLMTHRHRLEMTAIEAKTQLAWAEAEQTARSSELMAKNSEIRSLREAIRADAPSSAESPRETN